MQRFARTTLNQVSLLYETARSAATTAGGTLWRRNVRISRAHGKRLRYGGGIPGIRYGGKLSTELVHRGESVLESVRLPQTVVDPIKRWRVIRGDFVQVTSGPEKGKRGRVIEVIRASNRVLVEGVQLMTKKVPIMGSTLTKTVTTEAPIYVSRVNVICPQTNLPTRIRFAFLEDGTKVRVAVRSGAIIPRPEILKYRRKPRPDDTPKDTSATVVLERTFKDEDGLYAALDGFESVISVDPIPDDAPTAQMTKTK